MRYRQRHIRIVAGTAIVVLIVLITGALLQSGSLHDLQMGESAAQLRQEQSGTDTEELLPAQRGEDSSSTGIPQGETLQRTLSLPPLSFEPLVPSYEFHQTETLESWCYLREERCADYALTVLESLRKRNVELLQAGYMDLSGESWGCVFIDGSNESYAVMLIPKRPFSVRSADNPLVVTIIHYLAQEELA